MSNEPTALRVALIGAPGSGKSLLARELAKELDLCVVDDYVEKLEQETDLALGFLADFLPNLLIQGERWRRELGIDAVEKRRVTCGTVLDTTAYVALWAADTQPNNNVLRATMDTLTMYMWNTWNYDHVFYLPLQQGQGSELDQRLDFSIRDALAMLHVDHVPLTNEDQLQQTLDSIQERNEAATDSE